MCSGNSLHQHKMGGGCSLIRVCSLIRSNTVSVIFKSTCTFTQMKTISLLERGVFRVPQLSELIVPTVETVRQLYFLQKLVGRDSPVLFVGPTGTGKSVLTRHFLLALPKAQYIICCANFSARTTADQTQDIVFAKLDR